MKGRISPDLVTNIKENEVFVFGSNTAGRHGKGAAKQAMTWGAKYGQGAGLQGRTYGIPTKGKSMKQILTVDEIKVFVNEFIEFAKANPQLTFLCTEIGCGLSKYRPKDIAPLFAEAVTVTNIHLPARFWHKLIKEEDEKA